VISNRSRLYENCPPAAPGFYSLRLVDHFFIEPLHTRFDLTITGAWRSINTQANLTYADGTPVPADQKAKGTSQHCYGEATDVSGADDVLRRAWLFALKELRPWQAILYMTLKPEGPVWIATSMHLSIPSVVETVESKRLLNIGGKYRWWRGDFPDEHLRRT